MKIKYKDLEQVEIPDVDESETLKAYIVPTELSADRYYVSITQSGYTEVAPPSKSKDTLLVLNIKQDEIVYKHNDLEVEDA